MPLLAIPNCQYCSAHAIMTVQPQLSLLFSPNSYYCLVPTVITVQSKLSSLSSPSCYYCPAPTAFTVQQVPSCPSSAKIRLVILDPLQSKMYVFWGAEKLLQKPGVGFRIQLRKLGAWKTLVYNSKYQNVATAAIILLQKPCSGCRSQDFFAGCSVLMRLKIFLQLF